MNSGICKSLWAHDRTPKSRDESEKEATTDRRNPEMSQKGKWGRFGGLAIAAASLAVASVFVWAKYAQTAQVEAADPGWVSIFNGKNLDGWYTYLQSSGKNNDPKGIIKVENGMIHVFDIPTGDERQEFGYMATEKEYSNCRIRLQYKWGTKQFRGSSSSSTVLPPAPRVVGKRDAGLLYDIVGADKVWPRLVEAQIQEGDTGDFWLVEGVSMTTTVESKENATYKEGGVPYTQTNGRVIKSANYEQPGWNTVEVILDGDSVTQIVNGKVNNRGWNLRQPDPQNPNVMIPLTGGKIALEAEGAEVYYRDIQVKLLVK